MAEKVTLPDGGWALIRTATEVPERLRRAYLESQAGMITASGAQFDSNGKMVPGSVDSAQMAKQVGPVHDALILAYVKSWSLLTDDEENPQPLVINLDNVMDLPGGTYDALYEACEKAKGSDEGVVNANPGQAGDPDSPIEPLVE